MNWVAAIVLAVGAAGAVLWIVGLALAGAGADWADPDQHFGVNGRRFVAATSGFGIAGLSASYAGWPDVVSAVAALLAGGALGWLAGARSIGERH